MKLDERLANVRQLLEGDLSLSEQGVAVLRKQLAREEERAAAIRAELAEFDARFPEKVAA